MRIILEGVRVPVGLSLLKGSELTIQLGLRNVTISHHDTGSTNVRRYLRSVSDTPYKLSILIENFHLIPPVILLILNLSQHFFLQIMLQNLITQLHLLFNSFSILVLPMFTHSLHHRTLFLHHPIILLFLSLLHTLLLIHQLQKNGTRIFKLWKKNAGPYLTKYKL